METGYPIAAEAFDYEVFQLACTFASSRELSRRSHECAGIGRLCQVFQVSEAARHLISVAAMVRSSLDTWSSCGRRAVDAAVGELTADTSKPTAKCPLGFREACNKILHAEGIDLIGGSGVSEGSLAYKVVLVGCKRNHEWQAILDVLAFVDVASRVG